MRAVIAGVGLLVSILPASAGQNEIIARCSLGNGYAYYAASPIVPNNDAGWREDGFTTKTPSQVILLKNGDQFDLITTDTLSTKSATSEGATVIAALNTETKTIQVTALYPSPRPLIESYMLSPQAALYFGLAPEPGAVLWV